MTYRDKQHQRYMTALKQGHYATAWAALKPTMHPSYHPIIDDRLALLDSYINTAYRF